MGVSKNIIGAIITVAIGGTVYTVNQSAVVDNFAKDTGLTQQQAQEYSDATKDNLVSWDTIGKTFIEDGQSGIDGATKIDCDNYTYEWVSPSLTCENGKYQLNKAGSDEVSLGNSYIKLSSKSASKTDMSETIRLIDEVNSNFKSEMLTSILGAKDIDEYTKTNSYNKATLKSVLDSN